jgi:hypothetical protein
MILSRKVVCITLSVNGAELTEIDSSITIVAERDLLCADTGSVNSIKKPDFSPLPDIRSVIRPKKVLFLRIYGK